MTDSPETLQNILIDYISSNLTEVCTIQYNAEDGTNKLVFRDPNAYAHQNIANILLKTIDRKGELDDLVMTLFDPCVIRLNDISIHNASNLSCIGLKVLKSHALASVEVWRLTSISINDLISCFGEWTLNNITSLSLHGSLFFSYSSRFQSDDDEMSSKDQRLSYYRRKKSNLWLKIAGASKGHSQQDSQEQASASVSSLNKLNVIFPAVYIGLCKLESLQMLDLSETNIVSYALVNICNDLKHLRSLDISNCSRVDSIECLRVRKDTLKSVSLYNMKVLFMEETKGVLLDLTNLIHLDVSKNKHRPAPLDKLVPHCSIVPALLSNPQFGPNLKAIDLSGQEEVTQEILLIFIESHPNLAFLGLMFTFLCYESVILNRTNLEDCLVTGIAIPSQLTEALKRYPRRREYVPKILYEIFTLTANFDAPRPDIIKRILPVMQEHQHEAPIQLAGTACLYNLTKGTMGEGVHPHILKEVVYATLSAMNNFPNHPQLQKNALLTLCCDRILHEVTFDKYWCAHLVLECLLSFNDQTTDRMAVAICSILAAKISTSQTALLGASHPYMTKLLRLVESRMQDGVVDITLKFTLSALWNLTDESPATCDVFLAEKGLQLFLGLLDKFPENSSVETKVLGLFNNIAEVSRLRIALINKKFIQQLRTLLRSEQVEVSYFAAGIVAHLVCAGNDCWKDYGISRDTLLTELGEVVLGWKQPDEEMVAYRSFQPFIPLLMALDKPQVQLWAVWALHHVTTKDSSRYCPMLIREGVDDVLRRLIDVPNTSVSGEQIQELAVNVVKLLPEVSKK